MKSTRFTLIIAFALAILTLNLNASLPNLDPKGGTISGKIVDATTRQPLEYVNIAVYQASDSLLVTGTITTPEGIFKIEKIPFGEYYLTISFLGFNSMQTGKIQLGQANTSSDLGEITLAASALELKTVGITAEKSKVEYQIDKRVINVDQALAAKGGSAVNVLENTPSIQVDPQGNVTLRGSSDFVVLIDGKPTAMKGSDALKQINAASIKQIEVITNPSARYDADGQAGIINIIRKKEYLQGISGNFNTSLGTTDKYTANGLVSYLKGKVNVFGGIDFADNIYRNNLYLENKSYLPTGTRYTQEDVEQFYTNQNLAAKAGIDYDPDSRNSFTLSGSYGKQGYDQGTTAEYNNRIESSELKLYNTSKNSLDVMGWVTDLNLGYTLKLEDNHTLSVSNYYFQWDGRDVNNLVESTTDEFYDQTGIQSALSYVKDNFNFQYRLNVDYKVPVKNGSLETGLQFRYENRQDELLFKNLEVATNTWNTNNRFSYDLDYVNSIYSGYATYSGKFHGFGYMAGVRTEYFSRNIRFSNEDNDYIFDKFMLYPSLHFSKDIKGKHQFQLSYSRRINRPMPWLLNKTPGYVDPYNIFQGSPYLEPEYTDAYEFNYRLVYKIASVSAQTYYRNTTNSFNTLRTLQNDGVMVHELINSDNQKSYGIESSLDLNLKKWWQLSTGGNIYYYTMSTLMSNAMEKRDAISWDARLVNNFSLKWGTRLQAVAYFRGAGIDASGKSDGFYVINLAVSQPLLKGKANIGLSAQNLFDSIKFDYTSSGAAFDNLYRIDVEGPTIMLTASYNFNNFQNKQRGRADDANFKSGGMF